MTVPRYQYNPTVLVDPDTGEFYKSVGTTSAVSLLAGTAIVGKVGIDQTTDGTTNRVNAVMAGDSYSHITTAATTVVKASAGTIKKVSVNSKGTVASTVSVQDDATVLAVIDSLNLSGTWDYNIACATNITIVTTGTVAPDVTVTYR